MLHGTGSARLDAELGVPATTVHGWLRRLRARAAWLLQEATAGFGFLVAIIETPDGPDPAPPGPAGAVLGDALAAVAACAHAAGGTAADCDRHRFLDPAVGAAGNPGATEYPVGSAMQCRAFPDGVQCPLFRGTADAVCRAQQ